MEDLSLHILDIAENSLAAGACNIGIIIREDVAGDRLCIEIIDDGRGMSTEMVEKAADPFTTTRTTRSVGLGLPLLREAAVVANGALEIRSAPENGTTVKATFQRSHIDRKPLGDMAETITALLASHAEVNIYYEHTRDGSSIVFDTDEVRDQLGGAALNTPEALSVIRGFLNQKEETFAQ